MKLKSLTLKPAALIKLAGYILITFAFISCTSNASDESESSAESLPEEKNLVDVILLEQGDFTREIISNGKLSAIQKAELYFKNPGIIESISYRNGQTAQKGSELARIQNDEYRFVVEKAEVNIEIYFETV